MQPWLYPGYCIFCVFAERVVLSNGEVQAMYATSRGDEASDIPQVRFHNIYHLFLK